PQKARDGILNGSGRRKVKFPYRAGGAAATYSEPWEGVLTNVMRRYEETTSDRVREQLQEFMMTLPCRTCGGSRLKPESLAVTVGGRSIGDAVHMSVAESLAFFTELSSSTSLPVEIAGPILKEVRERLQFLVNVGLEYLTLGRSAETLSGGEAQRIRLA